MMSLLNVTVKRGKISAGSGSSDQQQQKHSSEQHNTFLVLKLENVKSQTPPLKGDDPVWDEDFLFETNKTSGVDLLVELWQKGLIWDNVIGYKLIQVDQLFQGQIAAQCNGYGGGPSKFHLTRWFTLDADLLVAGGLDHQSAIIGTKNATPYMVLLDLRWELTSFVGDPSAMMDHGGGGGGGVGLHRPFVEHSSVDNYNKIDTYGSIIGYGDVAYEDGPDYPGQYDPYNNREMYSSTSGYNGLDGDDLFNRLPSSLDNNGRDDDNMSYLTGNSYGGHGCMSRESTFQDNNYSYYDNPNQLQQQPPSCDMTKRPKLLPQVPMSGGVGAAAALAASRDLSNHQQTYASANISDTIEQLQQHPPTGSGFSFDVYGTHSDPYRTSDCAPFNTIDNEYDYESEMAAVVRPARTRRKVLPSAPRPPISTSSLSQYNVDEFENEPLSYNSQPPAKFDDHRSYCSGGDMYDYEYELDSLMGISNHVDQLNWKNSSQGMNSSYEGGDRGRGEFPPPATRVSSKRKVLPQVPVHSKYGAAKSLPATPATSEMGINGKSRKLPYNPMDGRVGDMGIPTSTTITGFSNDFSTHGQHTYSTDYYDIHRPQFKSSLSADAGDEMQSMYHQPYYNSPHDDMMTYHDNHTVKSTAGAASSVTPTKQSIGGIGISIGKPSLLADMKSLLSKTSSSILPAMSSTLNNVSSSLGASIPPVSGAHVQPKSTPISTLAVNEADVSYDFMKSNKFEEAANHGSLTQQQPQQYPNMSSMYYDDPENQLNNNFNMGDQDQAMYGGGYVDYDQGLEMGYDDRAMMTATGPSILPKLLPSVPGGHQQVPYVTATTTSSTSLARNFFQSKNNTTFHSTVENISEEDPPSSSALIPSNMKMSTNNSYELEDMSVDKSLYGSSFHTDIDEYDLIANGDIKQNFTYTEKNLLANGGSGVGGTGTGDINGSGPLKTDVKSKLSHTFMDNDAVNNNSANRAVYGGAKSIPNDYVDEYSFNESTTSAGASGAYGNRSLSKATELDEYGAYDQQPNDRYYDRGGGSEEDQYYNDGYGSGGHGGRKMPSTVAGGQDANAQEYYYNQMGELGTGVVGSNLEGIEELDEYERDEKDVEDENSSHQPYDYDYYNNTSAGANSAGGYKTKKDSLKSRDHEFIEEEDEERDDDRHMERENSDEYVENEDDIKDDYRHHASDDEIIETEAKKTTTVTAAITTTTAIASHSEVVGPSPLSGISALMSSMAPSVATQSSLSPGSMLAAGITTTLAANISNTITTTITGSPSIIFDATGGENELGGPSTISKTMGALVSGEGAVKPTAKQRWHHAYNKIIMQLNVSTFNISYRAC